MVTIANEGNGTIVVMFLYRILLILKLIVYRILKNILTLKKIEYQMISEQFKECGVFWS